MKRMKKQLPMIMLSVLTALFMSACGSNNNNSSGVLWGHSVVKSNGTVRAWGANGFGQLGDGNSSDSHTPVTLQNYSSVSIGGGHTAAINSGGTVSVWGYNSNGQLGDNVTSNSSTPINPGLAGIKAVAAGSRHTLALANDGTVYAWGYNGYGQLANGGTGDVYTPSKVSFSNLPAGATITKIAAGGLFSLALDSNGNVWAWGDNTYGECGQGSTTTTIYSAPVLVKTGGVSNLANIVTIAAGGSHALAIDSNGNIWAWGYNHYGQLGNGTSDDQTNAVEVWNKGGVTAVSAGLDHSLALSNGLVYSCGHNYNGQLGNGGPLLTDTPFTSFQQIIGSLPAFASIIAVGNHSIAIDTSNHVWTWGQDTYGQLGDGKTDDRGTAGMIY